MAPEHKLIKTLGLADVFCISVGAMISAGIFLLPGTAFSHIGPSVMVSYVLGGILATLGVLAVLEMTTAMPQAGGIYYFATRSLGPLAGTMCGILNWAALALKSAFAIWGTAQVLHGILPVCSVPVYGVALTLFFLIVNLMSTAAAAKLEQLLVYLLLLIMVAYIVFGAKFVELTRFTPWVNPGKGTQDILFEAGFLFVSFGGLLGVISVAEEVNHPRRNIPLGILLGLLVVTILYGITMAVTVGVIPAEQLRSSYAPLAEAARIHFGEAGYWTLTVGALLAFITTGNAGIMGAARYPVALARDNYAPAFFARTYTARKIPVPALLLTGGVVAAVQFLDIESIVKVASTVVMLSYVLTNLSVIIIRESGVMNYRPSFRTPLYPVLPILCILAFLLLIIKLGDTSLGLSGGLIAFSIVLYMCYGLRQKREFALQQLVGRIAKPDYEAPILERELRDVVQNRDGLSADPFDHVIDAAPAFVMTEPVSLPELFREAARMVAPILQMDAAALTEKLLAREEKSSTVIAPGIALPHVMLPGTENQFVVVICKCENGVSFEMQTEESAPEDPVKTVVFIFSSENRRSMHLKTLANVAQIIIAPGFDRRWEKARSPQQLRDIFLLAPRLRR